ncbi:hypothetical protein BJZ21_004057 [Nocardioides panaciterrulae]|uniref:Uncharacterized protein n=1 Tax=Nocardioides panaciterrulae TaxID=661492 RepID=A0A7Y9E2R2_9ACTN|nr:hypothetical protein [Nocardioides panaciterrulae]NYD43974.1 hypothetical protein [Nocardioides panaciterrulae]
MTDFLIALWHLLPIAAVAALLLAAAALGSA